MRAHTTEPDEEETEPAPLARSRAAVSGNPLDLLPPRTRALFETLRSTGNLTAAARALGITKQTALEHRQRAHRILAPLAQATKAGVVVYRTCWLCREQPKAPGNSLCKGCRRIYMRAWRRKRAAERGT